MGALVAELTPLGRAPSVMKMREPAPARSGEGDGSGMELARANLLGATGISSSSTRPRRVEEGEALASSPN
jgi:hypothetical protein